MKKSNHLDIRAAIIILLAAIISGVLASCGSSQPSNVNSSTSGQTENQVVQNNGELFGKPWVSSIFAGNLPDLQPAAKDDLYTSCTYGYLKDNQGKTSSTLIGDAKDELRTSACKIIEDDSVSTSELEQLRILYRQASDVEALESAGVEELRPYLKAVVDTKDIDELKTLLASPDFPFSPWIDTTVSAPDMMSNMCIVAMPKMLFSNMERGTDMYRDAESSEEENILSQMRYEKTVKVQGWLPMLSICEEDRAAQKAEELFELEKAYGKDTVQDKHLLSGYGTQTGVVKTFTLDEIDEMCPNFPIRETLAKNGQDKGDTIMVMYPEWLDSFNSIWTEENFENLQTMSALKVLDECADTLSPTLFAGTYAQLGKQIPSAQDVAWTICDRTDTFSQLLAKTYVEQTLGEQTVDELSKLSNDLIDTYIDLVDKTTWLNATSRDKIDDKIDNMALNILKPDGGYFAYSELRLSPTDQGGTLFSNYLKVKTYNEKCEAELIDTPARASAVWYSMKPTMQNCFYEPVSNSINIFPGFISSTFYDKEMTSEELLGSMGFVVAHEISHAFDYSNSQFDAYGRPYPVFTADDTSEFTKLRDKLAERYSDVEVVPGKNIDGVGVSTEAMADLSGMQAIIERGKVLDEFDFDKMFERFATTWAAVYPESYADTMLQDIHAPVNARVNVSTQMMDAYYETYDVVEGDGMYLPPEDRIAIWGESSK